MNKQDILKEFNEHAIELFEKQDDGHWMNAIPESHFDSLAERLSDGQKEIILGFIDWFNLNYPDSYIPNSRLGMYLLTEPKTVCSDGWVKVEDRLPEEDENVWVANDHGVQLVSCMHMKGKFFPYDSPYPIKVTHWRALPPNPEK